MAEVEVGVGSEEKQRADGEGVEKQDEVIGQAGGYPTLCRPFHSQREIDKSLSMEIVSKWYEQSKIRLDSHAIESLQDQAKRILYTWPDLFISEVNEMPTTD